MSKVAVPAAPSIRGPQRLSRVAWLATGILLCVAFAGLGLLPWWPFTVFTAWYRQRGEVVRAVTFIGAFGALFAAGSLVAMRRGSEWLVPLVSLLVACIAASAATSPAFGDLTGALLKACQLGVAVAGVYVIAVAGPRELARWRRTKYDERAAEVAAKAISAADALLNALRLVASPAGLQGDAQRLDDERYVTWLHRWFGDRMRRIQPQIDSFHDARLHAEVILPGDVRAPLADVDAHLEAIQFAFIDWTTYADSPRDADQETSRKAYIKLFNEIPSAREAIRTRVRDVLRPIARYRVELESLANTRS